jgi:hypothetical protein
MKPPGSMRSKGKYLIASLATWLPNIYQSWGWGPSGPEKAIGGHRGTQGSVRLPVTHKREVCRHMSHPMTLYIKKVPEYKVNGRGGFSGLLPWLSPTLLPTQRHPECPVRSIRKWISPWTPQCLSAPLQPLEVQGDVR